MAGLPGFEPGTAGLEGLNYIKKVMFPHGLNVTYPYA